jgi:hypothetical protein
MSIEHFTLGILTVLLIGQQVYWARVVLNLTNKLMSRNYSEYVQAEKFKNEPRLRMENKPDDYAIDPEDERKANELNALFAL